MTGKSYDGVAGPGHVYAIDSTIGDIVLRSSINRAWVIGRPIVYVVVDVWSTAIVGFYVCLSGPSWETARCAIFSTCAGAKLLGELWGHETYNELEPEPMLPRIFRADRGEYVSQAARDTALELGFDWEICPPYRPDGKGIVEVQNRIQKDEQYQFMPGAIDVRRKELELKMGTQDSALTLQEHVNYLASLFNEYNLTSPREDRLTAEMIAANVYPSPAGLWNYGHKIGLGYQKKIDESKLITCLLPKLTATVRPNGLYIGQMQYDAAFIHEGQLTAQARNFGVFEMPVFHFPGSVCRVWAHAPNSKDLTQLSLHPAAKTIPSTTWDEWTDAYCYEKLKSNSRQYDRLRHAISAYARNEKIRSEAIAKTRTAESEYDGPAINTRAARHFEKSLVLPSNELDSTSIQPTAVEAESYYSQVIDEVLRTSGSEEVPQNAF